MTASGHWRPGPPKSRRFATSVSHQVGYLVALDYLLATMQAELSWLREFAGSLRSGQLEWPQAASDSKTESQDEVEK